MAFVVVYDACVLYPAPLRDLLMRVAHAGLVRARWTDKILDECFRSIAENRPELRSEALARTRQLMIAAVADCMVTDYEPLIAGLQLPDADDRHVLAAAIRCAAHEHYLSAETLDCPVWLVPAAPPGPLLFGHPSAARTGVTRRAGAKRRRRGSALTTAAAEDTWPR